MLTQTENWRPALDRFQRLTLIVGVVGAVVCGIGAALGPAQFFHSLMFAFFFWMTLTIGTSIVLMIQHLTSGVWGLMLRRLLEATLATLPVLLVVFLVLAIGMRDNYSWMDPAKVAESKILQFKQVWLNQPFYILRGVLYFAAWIGVGYLLNRWSSEQDRTGDPKLLSRLAKMSGPGIPIFVLLFTLAATDWGMSLEPDWFSSMYPVTFIIEGMLAAMAWGVLALSIMRSRKMLPYDIPTDRLHDLGKFMFAFTILWTYINFSQFLIIWSGNIPEETTWYGHRLAHGWDVLAVTLMVGHFFIPLFGLISRHPKRNFTTMTIAAIYIIAIQIVFVFWSITPAFFPESFHIHLLDIATLVTVGAFWMSMWARKLKQRPLLPPNDQRMPQLEQQVANESHGHSHGEAKTAH